MHYDLVRRKGPEVNIKHGESVTVPVDRDVTGDPGKACHVYIIQGEQGDLQGGLEQAPDTAEGYHITTCKHGS